MKQDNEVAERHAQERLLMSKDPSFTLACETVLKQNLETKQSIEPLCKLAGISPSRFISWCMKNDKHYHKNAASVSHRSKLYGTKPPRFAPPLKISRA